MNPAVLYLLGTLAGWIGAALALRAAYFVVRLIVASPGTDVRRTQTGLSVSAIGAAVLLLVALAMPMDVGRQVKEAGFRVPLAWVMMPFFGWLTLTSLVMVAVRGLQSLQALAAESKIERRWAGLIWLAVGIAAFVLFLRGDHTVQILRGALVLQPPTVVIIVLLALGTMVAMGLAGRAAAGRGYSKAVITHVALVLGSILFCIPFAWLIITSFKEDRDMASQSGLVWVPRVTETRPFLDPKQPLFAGTFEGRRVEGTKVGDNPDGTIQVDILRPAVMRGRTFSARPDQLTPVPRQINMVRGQFQGREVVGETIEDLPDGSKRVRVLQPAEFEGQIYVAEPKAVVDVRNVGLRWQNYTEALEFLPPETNGGLVYLRNTLILVVLGVAGTLISCSIVAYAFSRLRFPGRNALFIILLSTMMLPGAVTLLPTFLIFRSLGWIDTLLPLWVPAFFASAFNVFLLRQFFMSIPMELEDAAKIDGCSYLKTFWAVMMPQIKPALAVIAIWTFMGAWNNFMGPLIYINSPESMPIAYAVQLFQGDRGGEPGLMMAFATMAMLPVLALFFFAQRYFIEGVTLSGLGGR